MGFLKKIFKPIVKIFEKAVSLVAKVFSAITSPFGMNIDVPDYDIGSNQTEAIQGVLLNKDSAVVSIPVVYGTRRVGGTRVFVSTNGTNNTYLYMALVLSEGQVNGYTELLIDDNTVPLNSYAHGVETTASTGLYKDRILVQFFDGRDDQTVSTLLDAAPEWTSDHRLRGLAYIAFRFEWRKVVTQEDADNNPYRGGLPNVKVTLQGRKIFDLVAGYTPTEYATLGNSTATPYNPDSYTINGQGTQAFKTTSLTVTNSLLQQSSTRPNTLPVTAARTDAQVKVTMNISVANNNNNYAQYQMGVVLLDQGGGNVKSVNNGTVRRISLDDGTVSDSFELTLALDSPLGQQPYAIEPFFNISALSGTVSATTSVTVEVQTPEVDDHTALYADEPVVFNNNPVNVLLDYMRNPRYGKNLANDSFDWFTWREAALLCDQTVTYANAATSKAFATDAVIETENSMMTNCKILLANFRCMMPYTAGRYRLQIEHGGDNTDITATPAVPPVIFTVTNNEMIGGIQLNGESKEYKCNRAVVTYVDPAAGYEPNDVIFPEEDSADDIAFLAQDGVRLEKRITLPALANRLIAEQYARVFVKRSRNQKTIAFSTTMATSNATVGDLIRVINEYIGLDGIFRITDIRIVDTGQVEFSAIEHQSSAFAITGSGTDYIRPTLNLPNPDLIEAPTAVTLESGAAFNLVTNTEAYVESDSTVRRLRVSWTASADPFARAYLVQFKKSSAATFTDAGTTVGTEILIPGVELGVSYDARVATLNEVDNRSAFVTVTNHTIIA